MYRVFLERAAEKDLKDLPSRLHNRIIVALQTLAKNPRPAGCRKLTGSDNDWRIRVGDYRIVYEIDDTAKIIRVNRVRHRAAERRQSLAPGVSPGIHIKHEPKPALAGERYRTATDRERDQDSTPNLI